MLVIIVSICQSQSVSLCWISIGPNTQPSGTSHSLFEKQSYHYYYTLIELIDWIEWDYWTGFYNFNTSHNKNLGYSSCIRKIKCEWNVFAKTFKLKLLKLKVNFWLSKVQVFTPKIKFIWSKIACRSDPSLLAPVFGAAKKISCNRFMTKQRLRSCAAKRSWESWTTAAFKNERLSSFELTKAQGEEEKQQVFWRKANLQSKRGHIKEAKILPH